MSFIDTFKSDTYTLETSLIFVFSHFSTFSKEVLNGLLLILEFISRPSLVIRGEL